MCSHLLRLSYFIYHSKIILVAVQDEGSNNLSPAVDALKRVGAVEPVMVEYRGSFAFIGYADADTNKPVWITQQVRGRGQGPSVISSRIPLSPSRRKEKGYYSSKLAKLDVIGKHAQSHENN